MNYSRLFVIILLTIPTIARAQSSIAPADSVAIKNQIEGFYTWYVDMIKEQRLNKDFNPVFVCLENGMTALDFRNYKDGLRKHGFSDTFIRRMVKEYTPCVDHLKNIPYESFLKFELDERERLGCDFGNTYEWTGGMEPIDEATLSRLGWVDRKTVTAIVEFTVNSVRSGKAVVRFKKSKGQWEIVDLRLER